MSNHTFYICQVKELRNNCDVNDSIKFLEEKEVKFAKKMGRSVIDLSMSADILPSGRILGLDWQQKKKCEWWEEAPDFAVAYYGAGKELRTLRAGFLEVISAVEPKDDMVLSRYVYQHSTKQQEIDSIIRGDAFSTLTSFDRLQSEEQLKTLKLHKLDSKNISKLE